MILSALLLPVTWTATAVPRPIVHPDASYESLGSRSTAYVPVPESTRSAGSEPRMLPARNNTAAA